MIHSLLLSLFLSTPSLATDCVKTKFTLVSGGEISGCRVAKQYLSESCHKGCELLREAADFKQELKIGEVGSPGYQLCAALSGKPFVFRFEGAPNTTLTLCKKNQDFADLNTLLHAYYLAKKK